MADFAKKILHIGTDMLEFILRLHIADIPRVIAYIVAVALAGYCTSLILIGVPCSIWEAVAKKKVSDDKQNKVIRIVAVCLSILLFLRILYECSQ